MVDAQRLEERFIRYARIWSQSEDDVADRYPSTPQQLEFAALLAADLRELGLDEVELDQHGYVTATLPASPGYEGRPTLGLLAHYDTYPGVSGKDVQPVVHTFTGDDLVLPGDPSVVIRVADNPALNQFTGARVITANGTTLLGADDKAGLAEILEATAILLAEPERAHPRIRLGFTPDEEVGMGTVHFDVQRFGADVAYTVDGSELGEVENETFSADKATIRITGRDVHPGYAKGKMLNALRIAARLLDGLPGELSPEHTEGREGFLHPIAIAGDVSEATLKVLVRDFTTEGLRQHETFLQELAARVESEFPGARIAVEIQEQYRNMRDHLDREPRAIEFALDAVRAAGIEPKLTSIRGGTDGSQLSAKGLPTPNLFAGGINFHSKYEWVAVPVMVKATDTLLHLARIWAERG